jgi:ferredoxin
MEAMLGLQRSAALVSAAPMLGREVEVSSESLQLVGGTAQEVRLPALSAAAGATRARVAMTDSSGTLVREAFVPLGAAATAWNWDGKDARGRALPDGSYRMAVTGVDANGGTRGTLPAVVAGTVTGLSQDGDGLNIALGALTTGFTAILMFNFSWFREQFCVVLCPYGRLQSVLHDKDSVTVAYRESRGEPRGKILKAAGVEAPKLGDCIDCKRCVAVCPTGIDIRDGLQMECLACTQCVDACDEVMDKVKRPRGLIDFASQNELKGEPRRTVRPRLMIYAGLMLISMTTLGVSLATRTPFEANIFRPRGGMPFVVDGDIVRNAFEVHVFNKNPENARFTIALSGGPDEKRIVIGTPQVELASLTDAHVPVSISIPRAQLGAPVELKLTVTDETNGVTTELRVGFLGR